MPRFRLPLVVSYDVGITLLSVPPAMLANAIALASIRRATVTTPQLILGGTPMGAGVGSALGEGTTFDITLPIEAPRADGLG